MTDFRPKADMDRRDSTRSDRVVTAELGVSRKVRLEAVAGRSGLSVTELLRQMVDYCLDGMEVVE